MSTPDLEAAQQFVRALSESGDLEAFMEQHQAELTPVLADDVHALSKEALKAGAFDYASFAANTAGSVNLRIGRRAEALACHLLALQGDFQRATTVDEYEAVRSELLTTEERADGVEGADQTKFEARGFAVQSGYFACEAATSPEPAESLIRRSLEDLVALLDGQPSPLPPERITLLMAFAYPTLDLATARVWLDEGGGIDAALSRIAAEIEGAIPEDAQLSEDPSRDAGMTEVLARLATRSGG
jgi:hypothetical protein